MTKEKTLLSLLCGIISSACDKYALMFIFVAIAVIMDVITGIVGANASGEPISSQKGKKGFWGKMALFCALFFGVFLDYFIPYATSKIGIVLPFSTAIFAMTFSSYIIINECISIAENIYKANPNILPKWVVKMLESAKEQIDKEVENE